MCNYQGHEFGASYLDSVCIDGFLWDADSGEAGENGMWYYDSGGDIPCPECNHDAWLTHQMEFIIDQGYEAGFSGSDREAPFGQRHLKLKYPEDAETLDQWWLQGYDLYLSEKS